MSFRDRFPPLKPADQVSAQDIDWSGFRLPDGVIGQWRNWSPTLNNLTKGNGTQTARYTQVGKLVVAEYALVFGSTSAMGTNPNVSLPVTAVVLGGNENNRGSGEAHDDSVGTRIALAVRATPTVAALHYLNPAYTGITATAPFTWTTSDVIQFTITYEAA